MESSDPLSWSSNPTPPYLKRVGSLRPCCICLELSVSLVSNPRPSKEKFVLTNYFIHALAVFVIFKKFVVQLVSSFPDKKIFVLANNNRKNMNKLWKLLVTCDGITDVHFCELLGSSQFKKFVRM